MVLADIAEERGRAVAGEIADARRARRASSRCDVADAGDWERIAASGPRALRRASTPSSTTRTRTSSARRSSSTPTRWRRHARRQPGPGLPLRARVHAATSWSAPARWSTSPACTRTSASTATRATTRPRARCRALTRELAVEFGPRVRVNAVLPGPDHHRHLGRRRRGRARGVGGDDDARAQRPARGGRGGDRVPGLGRRLLRDRRRARGRRRLERHQAHAPSRSRTTRAEPTMAVTSPTTSWCAPCARAGCRCTRRASTSACSGTARRTATSSRAARRCRRPRSTRCCGKLADEGIVHAIRARRRDALRGHRARRARAAAAAPLQRPARPAGGARCRSSPRPPAPNEAAAPSPAAAPFLEGCRAVIAAAAERELTVSLWACELDELVDVVRAAHARGVQVYGMLYAAGGTGDPLPGSWLAHSYQDIVANRIHGRMLTLVVDREEVVVAHLPSDGDAAAASARAARRWCWSRRSTSTTTACCSRPSRRSASRSGTAGGRRTATCARSSSASPSRRRRPPRPPPPLTNLPPE